MLHKAPSILKLTSYAFESPKYEKSIYTTRLYKISSNDLFILLMISSILNIY